MEFAVNIKLIELAKIFKKNKAKLYIVGGFVRNSLLKLPAVDVDISSQASLGEVKTFIEGTNYKMTIVNARLGTAKISFDDKVWEYSTFRKEAYSGGEHLPETVDFATDIYTDAGRRDFTINAIYLDIIKGDLVDPFNGLYDIKRKKLRTTLASDVTLSADGIRILRMIRFASDFNLRIEQKTWLASALNASNLSEISGTRKLNELELILSSYERYPQIAKKKGYIRALNRFNSLKLWNCFYLPVCKIKLDMVKKVDSKYRFIALLIDIVNTVCPRNIDMFLNDFLGANGLCQPSSVIQNEIKIVLGYFDAVNKLNNKDFFFKYFTYFEDIKEILKKKSALLCQKYIFFYRYLINNKVAIQISDLAIKGGDIKKEFPKIPAKRYEFILSELLSKVFDGEIKNDKHLLLAEVKKYDY